MLEHFNSCYIVKVWSMKLLCWPWALSPTNTGLRFFARLSALAPLGWRRVRLRERLV
jgi:hypothetical protein